MTIIEILGQSGSLAMFCMGVVFGSLVTMVIAISATRKKIDRLTKQEGLQAAVMSPKNNELIAAICAAVNEYRKNN